MAFQRNAIFVEIFERIDWGAPEERYLFILLFFAIINETKYAVSTSLSFGNPQDSPIP